MRKRKNAVQIAYFVAILILVLGMIFSGLRILESAVFSNGEVRQPPVESKTITRDGVDYFPRQDITVIMALGIDEEGPVVSSGSYRNTGEADAVILLILDQVDESYTILCLNRDTMVNMPQLGVGGRQAGTYYGQLALSHTYGEGLADSCENTRQTISDLLYGITIDHYVAMNMDAIGIVNDAVGGVTVNVEDDFSQVDPSITQGRITLRSGQALTYLRSRRDVGNQLNITRMGRHEEYMQGLMTAMKERLAAEDTFIVDLYDRVDEYMVTDCSVNVISGLMDRCAAYTLKEVVSPEGENVMGEEFMEFHVEEAALDALILRLFYAPK